MLDLKQPGCYSHAATNDPNSEYCQKCVWVKSCTDTAKERLLKIHEELNVTDIMSKYEVEKKPVCSNNKERKQTGRKKVKKFELSEEQSETLASLPKKTSKLITQLYKKGINLKLEVKSGINPFDTQKPIFMRTPIRMLIEGGFSRAMLSNALSNDFPNWTNQTRKSHESIIMNALNHLQIIEEDNGYYKVSK